MNRILSQTEEIRVVAPSQSWSKSKTGKYNSAFQYMQKRGYKITFGNNIKSTSSFGTALPADRTADLHAAYSDKNVKAIWCMDGGWSANEILPLIDWELVSQNPKPLIGYSDITALINAIFTKAGQTGLLGPVFTTMSQTIGRSYTTSYLEFALAGKYPFIIEKSRFWSEPGQPAIRTRWKVVQPGTATGTALGGNLGTLYLLQGTEYMPQIRENIILFIEDDAEVGKYAAQEFSRRLESLLQQPQMRKHVKGIVVGRFQSATKVKLKDLANILQQRGLTNIPIIANADFGHTIPMFTIPVGSTVQLNAFSRPNLTILGPNKNYTKLTD